MGLLYPTAKAGWFCGLFRNNNVEAFMQAIRLEQTIQKSGELHLTNLPVFEGQYVELFLLFVPKRKPKKRLTARLLLESGLMGMWKDRTDIVDSAVYARQLREKAQRRHHDYSG